MPTVNYLNYNWLFILKESDQLSICCDKMDLAFLGAGFPLYYQYIFFCCLFLTIIIFVMGIYNFSSNLSGDDCNSYTDSEKECYNNWVNRISIGNKKSNDT